MNIFLASGKKYHDIFKFKQELIYETWIKSVTVVKAEKR